MARTVKKNRGQIAVILGMHRSGTSAVANLFDKLGFFLGNEFIDSIEAVNAHGFWEHRTLVDLDEKLLSEIGIRWYDPLPVESDVWDSSQVNTLRNKASVWLKKEFSGHAHVAIKDPRLCRLLPFWEKAADKQKMTLQPVFVIRHPDAVIASLGLRDGIVPSQGYLLWLLYVTESFSFLNKSSPIIDYDALLSNWKKVVNEQLVARGVLGSSALTPANVAAIEKVILPGLQHHRPIPPIGADAGFRLDAIKLYKTIKSFDVAKITRAVSVESKRLDKILHAQPELRALMVDASAAAIDARRSASDIGNKHSHALAVIHDKDIQLKSNANYIEVCHDRIRAQDDSLSKLGAAHEQYEHSLQVIHDRDTKLEENLQYINECKERIRELESVSLDRSALDEENARLSSFVALAEERLQQSIESAESTQAILQERDVELVVLTEKEADLKSYVATCELKIAGQDIEVERLTLECGAFVEQLSAEQQQREMLIASIDKYTARISEQDHGLLAYEAQVQQAKSYISQCEARIHEQDNGIAEMLSQIRNASEYIAQCEQRIREQDDGLASASERAEQLQRNGESYALALQSRDNDIEHLQSAVKSAREEVLAHEQSIAKIQVELNGLVKYKENCAQLTSALADRDAVLAIQVDNIRLNEQKIRELESWGETLNLLQEQSLQRVAECEAYISSQNTEITRLNAVEEQYTAAITELNRRAATIGEYEQGMSDRDREIQRLSVVAENYALAVVELSQKESLIVEQKQSLLYAEETIAGLESEKNTLVEKLKISNDDVRMAHSVIDGLSAEQAESKLRISELESHVTELAPFPERYEQARQEFLLATKRIGQLVAENRVILLKLMSVQSELDNVKSSGVFNKLRKKDEVNSESD